jgi:drug/metabolite transporter (DMT)-like permease
VFLTAILAALAAAILYGTGAALQQHQAAAAPREAAGRPSLLLLLMRRPWWLLGIGAELGAFSVHAFALRSGPLTVVQMLTASSLIFSVATVRLRSGRRLGWITWGACCAVVAGIGAFVALTGPGVPDGHGGPARAVVAAACLAVSAVPFAVTGLAATGRRRAALLAVAAALADACIAVVTMVFAHTVGHGPAAIATSWATYALAVGGPGSLLLTQTAYQAGRPMITLPIVTVVTPVASLAVGAGLLGEVARMSPARGIGAGLAVLVTVAGLAGLARLASADPDSSGRRRRGEPLQDGGPAAAAEDDHVVDGLAAGQPVEEPVFQLDRGLPGAVRGEPDLDLAGVGRIGVVLPLAVDLPRDDQPVRRVPGQHPAPVAFAAVIAPLVPPAPFAWFQDGVRHLGLADVVVPRPPGAERAREDVERPFYGHVERDLPADVRNRCWSAHQCSCSGSGSASAAFWNDVSASSQTRSR